MHYNHKERAMKNHKERERKRERTINGVEQHDIVSYESRLYRVLTVRYWYDYDDAVALLKDIETGEIIELNTRVYGLKNLKGLKNNCAFKPTPNHRPAVIDIG